MPRPAALAFTIDIVDASIADAASRGDGAGLLELRRKLQAVTGDPPPPSSRRELAQARIELERWIWGMAIDEFLLPDVKEAFVAALQGTVDESADDDRDRRARDDPHHRRYVTSDDPWVELDPHALEARDRAIERELLRAQQAAVEACRRYETTRQTSHLRDAVGEIDAAMRFRRDRLLSGLAPGGCAREAERLGRALLAALSPRAFRFFVVLIRDQIAIELEERALLGRSSDRDGIKVQLLSESGWADPVDQPLGSEGPCFVDLLQRRFDAELEGERLKEEAEERRLADDEQRYRAWKARRDEEARSAQTEAERDGGLESLDAETGVSSAESAETPAQGGLQDERDGIVDEHGRLAPPGSVSETMHPAMAAAVEEEHKRRARFDGERARREALQQEYRQQLRSRG